jgi:hypothetical protein
LETAGGSVIALGHLQSIMSRRGFYTITLNPAGWTAGGMTLATPLVFTHHNYLVGDMNGDGQFNNLDIAPFVSLLTNGRPGSENPRPVAPRWPIRPPTLARPAALFGEDPLNVALGSVHAAISG